VLTEQLNTEERAILLVLLAEGRELTNPEMHDIAGVTLDGKPRRRLEDGGLVASRRLGRPYAFVLTKDGADWCNDHLAENWPARTGTLGKALRVLLVSGLRQRGQELAEVVPFRSEVEQQIRGAYWRLVKSPGDWVGLADLRPKLAHLARESIDTELERMASTPGVHVQSEPNQKALSDADRKAAVRFGGDERHMLKIEAE
jgi:hypothetical protein